MAVPSSSFDDALNLVNVLLGPPNTYNSRWTQLALELLVARDALLSGILSILSGRTKICCGSYHVGHYVLDWVWSVNTCGDDRMRQQDVSIEK
jgi:hypothetical protein